MNVETAKSFVRSEKKRNRKENLIASPLSLLPLILTAPPPSAPPLPPGVSVSIIFFTSEQKEDRNSKRREEKKETAVFLSFRFEGKNSTQRPQNPQPSPLLLLLLLSPASRVSALPVRAFKESSGAPSSKSKSKQGGLRALKSIELPKIDLLSQIELPPLEFEEMIKLPTADDVTSLATETASKVSSAWDASEEKPAVVALGAASFVVLVSLSAVADAVDSVPIFSTFFELVGLGCSGWLAFRHLAFGPDREALKGKIEGYWSRIFP